MVSPASNTFAHPLSQSPCPPFALTPLSPFLSPFSVTNSFGIFAFSVGQHAESCNTSSRSYDRNSFAASSYGACLLIDSSSPPLFPSIFLSLGSVRLFICIGEEKGKPFANRLANKFPPFDCVALAGFTLASPWGRSRRFFQIR